MHTLNPQEIFRSIRGNLEQKPLWGVPIGVKIRMKSTTHFSNAIGIFLGDDSSSTQEGALVYLICDKEIIIVHGRDEFNIINSALIQ